MANTARVLVVLVMADENGEWTINLGPFDRIINVVPGRGRDLYVYIERGDEVP